MNEIDLCLLLPLCVLYEIQNQIYQQRLPCATTHLGFPSCVPMCCNFRSRAPHALSRAFMRLNPSADDIADVIVVSLRCTVANVTCLHQPLMSSFDFAGLSVDLAGLTIDH